jgi:hypothetical protein
MSLGYQKNKNHKKLHDKKTTSKPRVEGFIKLLRIDES